MKLAIQLIFDLAADYQHQADVARSNGNMIIATSDEKIATNLRKIAKLAHLVFLKTKSPH